MNAGNRRRVLSYEERVLWTTVTKAIEPLRASAHFDAGDDATTPMAEPARPVAEPKQPRHRCRCKSRHLRRWRHLWRRLAAA